MGGRGRIYLKKRDCTETCRFCTEKSPKVPFSYVRASNMEQIRIATYYNFDYGCEFLNILYYKYIIMARLDALLDRLRLLVEVDGLKIVRIIYLLINQLLLLLSLLLKFDIIRICASVSLLKLNRQGVCVGGEGRREKCNKYLL